MVFMRSEWVVLQDEADEDNDLGGLSTGDLEEEDELVDEGEPVESDIDKVDSRYVIYSTCLGTV